PRTPPAALLRSLRPCCSAACLCVGQPPQPAQLVLCKVRLGLDFSALCRRLCRQHSLTPCCCLRTPRCALRVGHAVLACCCALVLWAAAARPPLCGHRRRVLACFDAGAVCLAERLPFRWRIVGGRPRHLGPLLSAAALGAVSGRGGACSAACSAHRSAVALSRHCALCHYGCRCRASLRVGLSALLHRKILSWRQRGSVGVAGRRCLLGAALLSGQRRNLRL
ncbi:hypothetical protein GGH99_007575, partial [Coemansia sp. RSA 1285]